MYFDGLEERLQRSLLSIKESLRFKVEDNSKKELDNVLSIPINNGN